MIVSCLQSPFPVYSVPMFEGTRMIPPVERVSSSHVSFGVITDIHFADRNTEEGKYFRHGLEKLNAFIQTCNNRNVDFVICLGDFIDTDTNGDERKNLAALAKEFDAFDGVWHAVPGNHDLETITKREFLTAIGKKQPWYSFDAGGCHFIILDACFSPNGSEYKNGSYIWTEPYIPWWELEWLASDLAATKKNDTIIFAHQNLHDNSDDRYNIVNSSGVRAVIGQSNSVRAVIQGHCHRGGTASLDGIPYITLTGSINGTFPDFNRFSIVTIEPDRIHVEGFGGQESLMFTRQ